jgi:hypothetical protein
MSACVQTIEELSDYFIFLEFALMGSAHGIKKPPRVAVLVEDI